MAHVLEPLSGYLILAEKLYTHGQTFAEAFNFGPVEEGTKTVQWVVEQHTNLGRRCMLAVGLWQSSAGT